MKILINTLVLGLVLECGVILAAKDGTAQREYEKSINAVVRDKHYYKPGRFEMGLSLGTMPYDSVVSHYLFGGKFIWHFHDHYGWEILDGSYTTGSVNSFTTDLVKDKVLSNLQTVKIKTILVSNLILSPFHGKIRFAGSSVIHFDVYTFLGGGFSNTDVLKFSTAGTGQPVTETLVKTGWDPTIDFGLGIKFFIGNSFALLFDARDYMVSSETYGNKNFKGNYAVCASATFFLPHF